MHTIKNPFYEENNLFKAIEYLFFKKPKLLEFCFGSRKDRLRMDSKLLLKEIGSFSSGDQVLIRIALDIWDGSGKVRIRELLYILDEEHFKKTISIITITRSSKWT